MLEKIILHFEHLVACHKVCNR